MVCAVQLRNAGDRECRTSIPLILRHGHKELTKIHDLGFAGGTFDDRDAFGGTAWP